MGELFIGVWQFCAEFLADRLGVYRQSSPGKWLALFIVAATLAVGLAIGVMVVLVVVVALVKAIGF
jgi:hypothetical protein